MKELLGAMSDCYINNSDGTGKVLSLAQFIVLQNVGGTHDQQIGCTLFETGAFFYFT